MSFTRPIRAVLALLFTCTIGAVLAVGAPPVAVPKQ